jgi:glycosyltransferase involved in cell wall biosynthesis
MYEVKMHQFSWRRLPIPGNFISLWQDWRKEQRVPHYRRMGRPVAHAELLPYPIDMFPLLDLPSAILDEAGVLCNISSAGKPAGYHPTRIAQYALTHWNAYLTDGESEHREAFMAQAYWLLAHELPLAGDAGGWPVVFASHAYYATSPWLSALAQGNAISVLLRAYQLTGEDTFLQSARRAVHTFELDILDGGVGTFFGDDGVFFEEIAVYPVAHILSGYILALFGLYDYVILTKDSRIEVLIERSVTTLHTLIDEFDTGYWTRYDLLHKQLASLFYHLLHITLLEALTCYTGCEHCKALAARWMRYTHRLDCCLRYLVISHIASYCDRKLKPWLRRHLFQAYRVDGTNNAAPLASVYVPITAFPVAGGMRGVLAGVAQVMGDQWQITYLTHHKGQGVEGLEIETFGPRGAHSWQFPGVWLYCLTGGSKLFALLRRGLGNGLILPQDGVYTGAFAALLGKIAGVRVVCMDHGNVTLLDNPSFYREQMSVLRATPRYRQILSNLLFALYLPSLRLLASIASRYADQFLIAGDEVEEVYRKRFGVSASRIIRYAYMVDVARFTSPCYQSLADMRAAHGLSEDAIVITLINRLAPEKGLHFALEGLAIALAELSQDVCARVRMIIAGDGPLRLQVGKDIRRYGLEHVCMLWGEAKPSDVVALLGISNIFLYSGTRGTNYSVAVLEAMATGCAVIATVAPQSNARLLAEGRGIAVAPGNAMEIGAALVRLCNDPALCLKMGRLAREYVGTYHSARMLKRSLLRASFFAPSIVVENTEAESS